MKSTLRTLALAACLLLVRLPAQAQPPAPGMMMLTVFLRHDESKPLGKINEELRQNKYYLRFPPAGVEVVSWYVMMGQGQVVTLRFPAERLREINRILEETAWGGYRTEFYPTYDYKPTGLEQHEKAVQEAAAGK